MSVTTTSPTPGHEYAAVSSSLWAMSDAAAAPRAALRGPSFGVASFRPLGGARGAGEVGGGRGVVRGVVLLLLLLRGRPGGRSSVGVGRHVGLFVRKGIFVAEEAGVQGTLHLKIDSEHEEDTRRCSSTVPVYFASLISVAVSVSVSATAI